MQQKLLAAVLLLSLLLLVNGKPYAVVKVGSRGGSNLSNLKELKNHRWFMNQLPTILYNLCALYYVSPDCLDDLFGEDFDISSMVAEICPS